MRTPLFARRLIASSLLLSAPLLADAADTLTSDQEKMSAPLPSGATDALTSDQQMASTPVAAEAPASPQQMPSTPVAVETPASSQSTPVVAETPSSAQQMPLTQTAPANRPQEVRNVAATPASPKNGSTTAPMNNTMQQPPMSNMGEDQTDSKMPAGYNMPGRVNVMGGWDFWGDASFIYWQVRPDNFVFAIRSQLPSPNQPPLVPLNYNTEYFHFKWKPGFKVGIGMNFPCDDWSLGAEYTYLRGTQNQSATSPTDLDPFLIPAWLSGNNSGQATTTSAHWRYHFDIVDLSLSRAGYFGKSLILMPFVGARFFINQQRIVTHTVLDVNSQLQVISPFPVVTHTRCNAWELGPRAGINGSWLLGSGFQFLGNMAMSLLYADFNSHHRELGNVLSQNPDEVAIRFHNSEKIFTPNLDVTVGFAWGSYVNQNKQHIDFSVKYDLLGFWNNNRLLSQTFFDNDISLGVSNLYLTGLTVSAKLDF